MDRSFHPRCEFGLFIRERDSWWQVSEHVTLEEALERAKLATEILGFPLQVRCREGKVVYDREVVCSPKAPKPLTADDF